jgi:HEAT repeat protein
MADKKTGYLFPEANTTLRDTSPKKPKKKSPKEAARETIQKAKDRQDRLIIIEAIAKSKEKWVCEVLIQALEDPSEDIRNFIIEELSNRDDLDLSLVYRRLHKPPWYVKTGCLRILGLKKSVSSLKSIESLVSDPNIEVRRTLAIVLGEIGGKKALALLAQLSEDNSSFVRTPAKQAIQDISQVKFS